MSNYDVRRMTLQDLHDIRRDTPEANLWGYLDESKMKALVEADSWTGLVDGQIVACGGIVRMWPGLAEAWIAVTPLARQHTMFLYRHVVAFLELVTDAYNLHRIEAHVNADFDLAFRFASRLGFRVDATLQKYGPNGEPFLLMSKVK